MKIFIFGFGFILFQNIILAQPVHSIPPKRVIVNIKNLADSIKMPPNYIKLAEIEGNLNADSVLERVVVFDTQNATEAGTKRVLQVYKLMYGKWILWVKSENALLPSKYEGAETDPFEDISINHKNIIIRQSGGKKRSWRYVHQYKFQMEEWRLSSVQVVIYNDCESAEHYQFDLTTGKVNVFIEGNTCFDNRPNAPKVEEEEFDFYYRIDPLPLKTFQVLKNEVKILNHNKSFFY